MLDKNQLIACPTLTETQAPPTPTSPPSNDATSHCPHVEQQQSPRDVEENTPWAPEHTILASNIGKDALLEHRTAYIESRNAREESCSNNFKEFAGLSFSCALSLELKRSTKMGNSELAACFDLIAKTSQQDYQASSRGWDPNYKMEEMQDTEMLYLLVRQAEGYIGVDKISGHDSGAEHAGAILGFLSFKFEAEDEELSKMRPVQYIYEIHLDDRLRGQSLGGRMIQWAESQARLVEISKMMLTVFTVNEGARRMYEREGYVKDESSPDDRVTRRKVIKADYIIMSKEL